MHKRIVRSYVNDELKKGLTIEDVRKRLISIGYKEEDVNEILRSFELREADLMNKRHKLDSQRTKVHVLLAIILLVTLINTAFFFYSSSNSRYVLLKETPTGFVTESISKEEIRSLEQNLNNTNLSVKGLEKIS